MDERQRSSGWYVDPERPTIQRYWDGERFTAYQDMSRSGGPDMWTIARGVALGILAVVAVLWILGTYVL